MNSNIRGRDHNVILGSKRFVNEPRGAWKHQVSHIRRGTTCVKGPLEDSNGTFRTLKVKVHLRIASSSSQKVTLGEDFTSSLFMN